VNYKTKYHYEDNLIDFTHWKLKKRKLIRRIHEGFWRIPRVVLEDRVEEKRKIMAELYQSYLVKDIVDYWVFKKPISFTALVRIMASQIVKMVNINELSGI